MLHVSNIQQGLGGRANFAADPLGRSQLLKAKVMSVASQLIYE
jgi:hypothetical protein